MLEPVDHRRRVAVGHEQHPRQLGHRQVVVRTVQRGHHIESRQRRAVLDAQELAQLRLGEPGDAQQPEPQPQAPLRQRIGHSSPPAIAMACPLIASDPGPHSHNAAAVTSAGSIRRPSGFVRVSAFSASASLRPGRLDDVGDGPLGHLGVEVARAQRVRRDARCRPPPAPPPGSGRPRRASPPSRPRRTSSPSSPPSRRSVISRPQPRPSICRSPSRQGEEHAGEVDREHPLPQIGGWSR